MVICKYFQQGTCRFGQYCKFEHIFANRSKTFGDEKNIPLLVAEEVLLAERGGQWLLSCYGPFREKKCIPSMEDVSPEEVRWEMYKAQKNGTVDQINAQFQQLCETMKTKREALKNPTPDIVQLLEEIQQSGTKKTPFVKNSKLNKANFPFGTSDLGISNSNQNSNVFAQNPFAASSNQFGANTFNTAQSSSIFGRPTGNTTSVFGGKPNFGSSIFGGSSAAGSSIFGGTNQGTASPFSGAQNGPTFGGLASQGSSIFGGSTTTQSTFGQPAAFGTNNAQINNSFLNPQTAQTSIFGGASSVGNSLFGNAAPTSATPAATDSVFALTSGASNTVSAGNELFGQSSTANPGFGGAPVFGGALGFNATQSGTSGSVFGGQSAFSGSIQPSSTNIFGGSNIGASSFGALAQNSNSNTFGSTNANNSNSTFETAPNATPFGTSVSNPTGPFGAINTANSVFTTTPSSASGSFNNTKTPFSKGATFGFTTPTTDSSSIFGTTTATSSIQSPFNTATNFNSAQLGSFAFANTTTTTTITANPFMAKNPQQITSSPFGITSSSQTSSLENITNPPNTNVFGITLTVNMDETAYSTEQSLTDDEKAAYCLSQFTEGYIPLRPPTKELS